ncbi:response regulator [Erythrobacter litoralis]|uniref:response regulator n=1 Tax=Erythrobacter litoralis TaxID=39960 RepID=UPI0024348B36|nr:response regulator [Erythrobacter litoralis]MDG6079403.1 response regulator [Erythrobacter litoralis]
MSAQAPLKVESYTPPAGGIGVHSRLLLAEDNAIASELITMMVRRLGHMVDRASNGLDAVEAVERAAAMGAPYGLVLMDAMMPILTGVEAARRIRRAGISADNLPIIAVSAATDPVEVREYLKAGMQGYLAKPVSLVDLSACIDAWAPGIARSRSRGRDNPGQSLRRRYELRKTEVLERFAAACADADFSTSLAEELRDHLHKLAGTAGSFGEKRLSEAASQGETLLIGAPPQGLRLAIERSYELLRAVA